MSSLKILGVNKRWYPKQGNYCPGTKCSHIADPGGDIWCEDYPLILAVLVAGEIGDYACYTGQGTEEWVAAHGDKISFEEACCHFPDGQLKRELYRG